MGLRVRILCGTVFWKIVLSSLTRLSLARAGAGPTFVICILQHTNLGEFTTVLPTVYNALIPSIFWTLKANIIEQDHRFCFFPAPVVLGIQSSAVACAAHVALVRVIYAAIVRVAPRKKIKEKRVKLAISRKGWVIPRTIRGKWNLVWNAEYSAGTGDELLGTNRFALEFLQYSAKFRALPLDCFANRGIETWRDASTYARSRG